jgi:PAS domain S-box-containing protein
VALPDPAVLQAHRLKNWGTAAALGGTVLLVGAMMLLFLRREETKRNREVQRRRDADARFAAILDTSDQAILSFDDTQRIVTFNRGAQRIFGWAEADALGQPIQQLFGWLPERSVFHDEGLRVGQVRELYGVRHNGEPFPAVAWTSCYRRGNRHVWTTIVEDVTLRKQLELENQRLAAFPKENPNPVVALEEDGRLIYANPAAERLQEGMGLDSVLHLLPADLPAQLPACVASECNVRGIRLGIADHIFEWEIHPIRPLRFVYVYGMDVTERLHAEEQSRLHLEELARVSRLSTMGEMASGLAHELNQPLAAIRNYVSGSLLRLERGDTASVAAALKSAGDQAERAARIIQRLRDMVRKRAPIRREVQLNDLVAAVVEMTTYEARRYGIEVGTQLDPQLPRVWVDPIQVEQVLLNLVRNAIEALHGQGGNPRRIAIFSRRLDADVVLTVEDNGPGVPLDPPDRVFDPFFTTKQDGMGMGLPISRTIVENHGGHLEAENKPDGGSRFRFHLPIERETEDDH